MITDGGIVFHRIRPADHKGVSGGNILLEPPPDMPREQSSSIIQKLMPLVMMIAVAGSMAWIFMSGVAPNPMMMLFPIMMIFSSVSMLTMNSGTNTKAELERRRLDYLRYLELTRAKLNDSRQDQLTAISLVHPTPPVLAELVGSARMWERSPGSEEWLTLRVGIGRQLMALKLVPPETGPTDDLEPVTALALRRLVQEHSVVNNAPVALELSDSHLVRIIGRQSQVWDLARSMIAQLTVFHPPSRIALVVVSDADEHPWEWTKWLPHCRYDHFPTPAEGNRLPEVPLLHYADWEIARREVDRLISNSQLTMEHIVILSDVSESRMPHGIPDFPHGVVTIDLDYVPDRQGTEREDSPEFLGKYGEPQTSEGVRRHSDEPGSSQRISTGRQRTSTGKQEISTGRQDISTGRQEIGVRKQEITLKIDRRGKTHVMAPSKKTVLGCVDQLSQERALAFARRLAAYRVADDENSEEANAGVPELTELLNLGPVSNYDVKKAWKHHGGRSRLRVPIGVSETGASVYLDLKESAQGGMGPHGLCIGATGSGKSELLRTIVVGLIATHKPEQLNLVLVDFKGGASFHGVEQAPHVSALITNLSDDLTLVDRMHDALEGEMQRRQELLSSAGGFANVDAYEMARARGEDLAPLPALVIIVDEFSELLTQNPEFTELFVAVGRLGRSLHIHLLLASQRLEEGRLRGLDSHLSFRLGLKTFSSSESRTVLGVSDAYELPAQPGAGFLKVDSGRITRFNAAYVSGKALSQKAHTTTPSLKRTAEVSFFGTIAPHSDHGISRVAVKHSSMKYAGANTARGTGGEGKGHQGHVDGGSFSSAEQSSRKFPEQFLKQGEDGDSTTVSPLSSAEETGLHLPGLSSSERDSSGLSLSDANNSGLDATVHDVIVSRVRGRGTPAHRVWLPPLPKEKSLQSITTTNDLDPGVPIAILDLPAQQRRGLLRYSLLGTAGHGVVVGAPQSGKTETLETIMTALCLRYSPEELHIFSVYLARKDDDAFLTMPQMAGNARRGNTDRIRRTVSEVSTQLRKRITMQAQESEGNVSGAAPLIDRDTIDHTDARTPASVAPRWSDAEIKALDLSAQPPVSHLRNIEAQNSSVEGSGQPSKAKTLPHILLVIDGWERFRFEHEDLEQKILGIAADGLSHKVHLLISTGRWGDIKPALRDTLGTRLELKLGDSSDSMVGRREAQAVPSLPGRGLDGYGRALLVARVDEHSLRKVHLTYEGYPRAPKVRMLPRLIDAATLPHAQYTDAKGMIVPVGVDEEALAVVSLDFSSEQSLVIIGDSSGKTDLLRLISRRCTEAADPSKVKIILVDYRRTMLGHISGDHVAGYAVTGTELTNMVSELIILIKSRLPNAEVTPQQLRERSWWSGPDVYLLVDDYDLVSSPSGNPLLPLAEMLPYARDVGLHVVIARRCHGISRAMFDPILVRLRDLGTSAIVMNGDRDEGAIFGGVRPREMPEGRAIYVDRSSRQRTIQLGVLAVKP